MNSSDHTYCTAGPGSLREKVILRARRKIYRLLGECIPLECMMSILDVGVTADRDCAYSNFFEVLYPHPERVTAFSNQDASWMCDVWKGLHFVRGDACKLPFPDGSFDLVFSSAVIEHVGSRLRQRQLISECVRVSKRHVLLTTPNRWFPLEMHSGLPLLHWLPPTWFRAILAALGFRELAQEANLNLLTAKELLALCNGISVDHVHIQLKRMRFLGFPSNLLLHIEKKT